MKWFTRNFRRHWVLLALLIVGPVFACGPFFPNTMLPGDDATLLAAPISDFEIELGRIALPPISFKAVISSNGLTQQTLDAEVTDLQAALATANVAPAADISGEMLRLRRQLQNVARQLEHWKNEVRPKDDDLAAPGRPQLGSVSIPSGLPPEFSDYLEGTVAFYRGDIAGARRAWSALLQRPKEERRYRSTWAAFMLGKTFLDSDPGTALLHFRQVRALADSGCLDTLGLAASSYGWEALAELKQGHFGPALGLYLNQHQTGDPTASPSLRMTVRKLLSDPAALPEAATDPVTQQIVTAYLVSRRSLLDLNAQSDGADLVRTWLQSVEQAQVGKVHAADRLALAAYQRGLFDLAERWLAHADQGLAMTQWIRAKLLLRAGQVQPAAKLLAQVVRAFPREGDWTMPPVRQGTRPDGSEGWEESPLRQSMGEQGLLLLARRQYYEAVDILLRAGYWSDAAYVAEYVLTPDEAAAYVDRQWPEPEPVTTSSGTNSHDRSIYEGSVRPEEVATEIRYLVARRLARLQRWNEAADFYPAEWRARIQVFVESIALGRDPSKPAADRAAALWDAAQIARHEGMELFGTEVEPDWHLFAGQFDWQHISAARQLDATRKTNWPTNGGAWNPGEFQITLAPSSADEQRRIRAHLPTPNHRFHYRYVAAQLAWESSQLLPNNDEDTAYILWTAGSWLKARDPIAADRFYKSLVRRCRRTALGAEADRIRWFPTSPTTQAEAPPPAPPAEEQEAPQVPDPPP